MTMTKRWKNLTTEQLADILAEFGIHEKPIGPNGEMGYVREDFEAVWEALEALGMNDKP